MALRKIIHVDMDAFFASIEQRDDPSLRGKPIAVGGGGKRGVVASASYEARKFGVRSAMPGFTAKSKCPDLIFVKSHFDKYREASQQIRAIFLEYTDLVEPLSLDEAYLDVTENKKNNPSATLIAEEIRKRIFETTQLTASAGVSYNKFLAKIASDINKPNGLKLISPAAAIAFIDQLPIEKFFGIGKVTAKRMHKMGITKGADLKRLTKIEMAQRFGKAGLHFYHIVRGDDNRQVNPTRIRKSIGAERTFFEDLQNFDAMWKELKPIAEKVFRYMENNENFGKTVTLKMKMPDFQILTRSKTYTREIKDQAEFLGVVEDLLRNHWQEAGKVRLLGTSVSNLTKEQGSIQLEFDFWE